MNKMKKLISVLLTIVFLCCNFTYCFANSSINNRQISDLGYVTTIIEEVTDDYISINSNYAIKHKVIRKEQTYYTSKKEAKCALIAIATFSIDYGKSVKCDKIEIQTKSYDDGWSVQNIKKSIKNSTKAEGKVSGEFTQKILGIKVKKIPVNMTITCDNNGNYY